ncbi:uncharacterized protein LOC116093765 [Mastomys coucha]|uniref:uncharacterized protein LOC116093765 n=1 Tax=Mastomys coucha TaxID=35658 RepID=UPI001261F190|nr:uncharacterized protein LOC116093765 [Mastomys coucha]XP_031231327.1 uncharacterized protein LOC116093765 [Mastomys coucha]XP_031231328.1 uncharacterized protein LOC116093765 [Mastomys coucha]
MNVQSLSPLLVHPWTVPHSISPPWSSRRCPHPTTNKTGACCPLRGSTQQLTKTDTDTHSQTVDGAWGLLWKNPRKDCRSPKGSVQSLLFIKEPSLWNIEATNKNMQKCGAQSQRIQLLHLRFRGLFRRGCGVTLWPRNVRNCYKVSPAWWPRRALSKDNSCIYMCHVDWVQVPVKSRKKSSDPLEMEFQAVVSHLTKMLGTELRPLQEI